MITVTKAKLSHGPAFLRIRAGHYKWPGITKSKNTSTVVAAQTA
jgi:hypothetical protein